MTKMHFKSFSLIRNAGHCQTWTVGHDIQTIMSCNTIGLFTLGVPNWDLFEQNMALVLTNSMGKVKPHDNVKM